jgi:long-chain acyl-CoA synthetase
MTHLSVRRFSARNVPSLLRHTALRCGSRRFIRELTEESPQTLKEYTFEQFERAVASTSEFLEQSGLKAADRVLFIAENSSDYQILSLAVQALRAEPCATFANLSGNTTCDIALRLRPKCVFVSSQAQWEKLSPVLSELVDLGLSLRISPLSLNETSPRITSCVSSSIATTPYSQDVWNSRIDAISPSDPFLILFTSGTSGKQKGVVLKQGGFVHAIEGGGAATGMSESDDGLMFLPFAHIAGQCQFSLAIALGHSLILAPRREDIQAAFAMGPTYAFAVPMVYEKLLSRVSEQIDRLPQPLRSILAKSVAELTQAPMGEKLTLKTMASRAVVKNILGRRVKKTLGGRIRMLASGGASAPLPLSRFFETIEIPFLSLYGMSETSGLICSQCVSHKRYEGTVGLSSPDLELLIGDDQELRVKGELIMSGYLDAEDNLGAFDEQGYFRTGDLVTFEPETGQYRIIGRSKNLLVLSTGKKISPEPIETELEAVAPMSGAVALGDGRPYVSVLLFISPFSLKLLGADDAQILANLRHLVDHHLAHFADFERPKRLLVITGSPSDWPEFVTPTLKLKRGPILKAYADDIEQLYALETGHGFIVKSKSTP